MTSSWRLLGAFVLYAMAFAVAAHPQHLRQPPPSKRFAPAPAPIAPAKMGLIVPAYFRPDNTTGRAAWDALTRAARNVPVIVIVNPADGPGVAADDRYVAAIRNVRAAGGKVIGYVHTRYAARALVDVTRDLDRYKAFYPLDGVFVDEMANAGDRTQILYYSSIYQYAKALDPTWRIVANPGTDAAELYMSLPATDILMNFEWTASAYKTYQPAGYMANYGAIRQAHLVFDSKNKAASLDLVDTAATRGAGWFYVTSDGGVNPWDTLPGYWDDLVRKVCRRNGAGRC